MSDELPAEVVERFLVRCRAEDAARGLPPVIEDPTVLDAIAGIVVAHEAEHQRPHGRTRRSRPTP